MFLWSKKQNYFQISPVYPFLSGPLSDPWKDFIYFFYPYDIITTYHKSSKYLDRKVKANTAYSDQAALKEKSDQGLHCLLLH